MRALLYSILLYSHHQDGGHAVDLPGGNTGPKMGIKMAKAYYVILDKNVGHLQWYGKYESPEAALAAFDADVGIDPHDNGIDIDDWQIVAVTPQELRRVKAWADRGHPADKCPACLD